jgi:hypothetical protein
MANHLVQQSRLPKTVVAGSLAWVGVLALAALLFALPEKLPALGIHLDMDPDMVEPYRNLAPWLGASSLILLAGVVLAHLRRKHLLEWSVALSLCSLLSIQLALAGTQALSSFSSMDKVAQTHAREFSQASHIYSLGTYDQTLDFYIQRTVILVAFRDELDFGLQLEPQRAIATQEAFHEAWQKDLGALAVMEPGQYRQLQQTGLPMRLIHEDSRHVIVARL